MGIDLKFDSYLKVLKEKATVLAKAGGFAVKDVMPWQVAAGAAAPAKPADLW